MRVRFTLFLLLVTTAAHAQKPTSHFAITGAKDVVVVKSDDDAERWTCRITWK